MVPLVQLVRASDCGSECHGFESHRAPKKRLTSKVSLFFCITNRRITANTGCFNFLHHRLFSILTVFIPGQKIGPKSGTHGKKISRPHLWPSPAQSKLREPFGVARAACFEELAGHRQLRCPALCKDLCKSEDKERYIPDTSELRSERLYFRIERLCGRLVERLSK